MSIRALKAMAASGGGVAAEPDLIEQSLMIDSGDGAYLHRTPGSAGNRRTFTWSGWVKRGAFSTTMQQALFSAGSSTSDFTMLYFNKVYSGQADGGLFFYTISGGTDYGFVTNARLRDTAAWYHVVYSVDTTLATAADRIKIYVNNQLISGSVFADYGTIPQNHQTHVNNTQAQYIGRYQTNAQYFDGYLAEVHFVDGTAYAPSVFAETNSETNQWIPKEVTGVSYGTNGFHFKFASGALGTDSSGNGVNYTTVNLANSDVTLDTPNNSFATLNPLYIFGTTAPSLSQGDLKFTGHGSQYKTAQATIGVKTGAWYWETYFGSSGDITGFVGIIRGTGAGNGSTYPGNDYDNDKVYGYSYQSGGIIRGAAGVGATEGETLATGQTTYAAGDIIGCAVDIPNGNLKFYKNGTEIASGQTVTGISDDYEWMPAVANYASIEHAICNFGQNGTFTGAITAGGNSDANGIGDFKYSVPSGYLALCTKNLATPTIALPGDHFNTVLYSGAGGSAGSGTTQAVTGVGFEPSLVWNKIRTTSNWHQLYDQVRGTNDAVFSNTTYQEYTYSGGVQSFDSDGFTVGNDSNSTLNVTGSTYVTWNWKGSGSGSSNTNGAITSTVSANTDAGFSIVNYTMPSSGQSTVGHGLGVKPKMILSKDIPGGSYNWAVFHEDATDTTSKFLRLNTLDSVVTYSTVWGAAMPTSSVFGVTADGNAPASSEVIAYCFAPVEGFSKMGSYVGNGSYDGPFIYTGFRPAWVVIKKISAGSPSEAWYTQDSARSPSNEALLYLQLENSTAEYSAVGKDFVANGFKVRNVWPGQNTSAVTYIYMAFAEAPFKYANAR